MEKKERLYIDGEWVRSTGSHIGKVTNPATEELIATIPLGTAEDADRAVQSAARAFPGWSRTSVGERAEWLRKIASGLKARSEQLTATIVSEVGMPVKYANAIQVGGPIAQWQATADLLEEAVAPQTVGNSLVLKEPVGVVVAITPWNYPLHQITLKVAAALGAGCTVVLKPSEIAPLNAFILAEVIEEIGLPPGVFNLVSGLGDVVGEALTGHPLVDMVSFTGSTIAGRRIAERAAAGIKRVALELGGKSASVVVDGADLSAAVKGTVASCLLNSGQTCSALTRLVVPRKSYEEVKELARKAMQVYVPGDPLDPATRLGPLTTERQKIRVIDYIRQALHDGAELVCGGLEQSGPKRGFYVHPTVLGNISPQSAIAQEEVFGPVLCVLSYDGLDEAIEIANRSAYGLGGAVWAATDQDAIGVASRIRTGQISINNGSYNLLAPFGGFKQSGYGREGGKYGIEEFIEYKSLQLKQ
jgi:betaine-aldehyde dehydrogenase